MPELRDRSMRSMIVGYNGLPLALIHGAELASRDAGIIVPFENVSLWPGRESVDHLNVGYTHPTTGAWRICGVWLELPSEEHFSHYLEWLTRVQRAGIDRIIRRRWSWWPWSS